MAFALKRPPRRHTVISVVSMIDVMMILLFFFMVTSTYLNLDMVPALQKSDDTPGSTASPAPATTLMIRIAADGQTLIGGQTFDPAALTALLQTRLAADPLTPIVLFPSGGAHLQDLIRLMDTVTRAGAVRVKVIRIEASTPPASTPPASPAAP